MSPNHVLAWRALFAVCLTAAPATALAQQNLFNVPSTTITPEGESFVQEQLNLGAMGESNTTMELGVVPHLELGMNVFHVGMYGMPGTQAFAASSFTVNAQVLFDRGSWFHVQLGTAQGLVPGSASRRASYAGELFTTFRIGRDGPTHGGFIFGGYAGSRADLGAGSRGGGMLGIDVPLLADRLRFTADWIVGTNAASVAVVGLQATVGGARRWQVSFGVGLPSPGSNNAYDAVFELTHLPSAKPAAPARSAPSGSTRAAPAQWYTRS